MPRAPANSLPRLREPQAQLLVLGLAMGYGLFISQLGLRWTVLLIGLGPPIGSIALWKRQERRRRNQVGTTMNLLDPAVFSERLNQLIDGQPLMQKEKAQWRATGKQLDAIHSLVVRCSELNTSDVVNLLVLLDTLLDHANHLASCLHQLGRAATPGARSLLEARHTELHQQLHHIQHELQSRHDSNLRETLQNQDLSALPLITPFPPLP